MLLPNIATALKHPYVAVQYSRWLIERNLLRRAPRKRIRNRITIGAFSGFSEYLAVDNFIGNSEHRFFRDYSFGPGCILDIGANIGVVSLFLANRFPNRTVYAIEPNPFAARSLNANIQLNEAMNVIVSGVAIADRCGSIPFQVRPTSLGTAHISAGSEGAVSMVPCTTLDEFVASAGITQIALLKVDVEGYESLVFAGGSDTIRRIRPGVIYFEVCPPITVEAGFDPAQPAMMLTEAGYSLFRLDPDGHLLPALASEIRTLEYANWVALPAAMARDLVL